jgi:hypothetical protein
LRRGGQIIAGTITSIAIICFEVVSGLIIAAYAIYNIFVPLPLHNYSIYSSGAQGTRRTKCENRHFSDGCNVVFNDRAESTMADGGDSVEEKVSGDER